MAEPSRRRATYQDLLDAPPHKVAEIINGQLYLSPRPAAPHASVALTLAGELGPRFGRGRGGPGGWIFLSEPELHFGEDIVVPDLAAWRRERLPHVDDVPFFTLAPDWICEVLSPSTEKIDRTAKLASYADAGVRHAWLVSARLGTVEVLGSVEGKWTQLATYSDDARVRAEPFDAIELDLSELWADLGSPVRAGELAASYGNIAIEL